MACLLRSSWFAHKVSRHCPCLCSLSPWPSVVSPNLHSGRLLPTSPSEAQKGHQLRSKTSQASAEAMTSDNFPTHSSQGTGAIRAFNQNQNMSEFVQVDHKVFFAAADRNKEVILDQLRPILEKAHLVLEVGSGSGQHVYRFSKDYPDVTFQPTEYDAALLPSIDAYAYDLIEEGHHILPALELDATNPEHWERVMRAADQSSSPSSDAQQSQTVRASGEGPYDLLMSTNVFHISPWAVGQSIVRGAGQVLKSGGSFVIYGPFKKGGTFNTESNREFDRSLRARDPSWGVRDIEEVEAVAKNEANLKLERIQDMPSNNYMLFFEKQ